MTYLLEALYVIVAYNNISRRFKMQSSTLPYTCPFSYKRGHFHLHQRETVNPKTFCTSLNAKIAALCNFCIIQFGPPNVLEYIGKTKRHLHQHRRSILNYGYFPSFPNPTLVSEHFNQADHSINDVLLIPLELIRSNRDSVRTAREAHLIDKAMTVEPHSINRCDEQW